MFLQALCNSQLSRFHPRLPASFVSASRDHALLLLLSTSLDDSNTRFHSTNKRLFTYVSAAFTQTLSVPLADYFHPSFTSSRDIWEAHAGMPHLPSYRPTPSFRHAHALEKR